MREFPVIDSASSVEQLRMRLQQHELERYGEAFTPDFVYEVIRRLPRFSTMRVSVDVFTSDAALTLSFSEGISKMQRSFWAFYLKNSMTNVQESCALRHQRLVVQRTLLWMD